VVTPDIELVDVQLTCANPQTPGDIIQGDEVKMIATVKNTTTKAISDIGDIMIAKNMKLGNSSHTSYSYFKENISLGAFEEKDITILEFTAPKDERKYTIKVDYNNKVTESNEDNNQFKFNKTFALTIKPDLKAYGLQLLRNGEQVKDYQIQLDDQIQFKVYLSNQGEIASTVAAKGKLWIEGTNFEHQFNIPALAPKEQLKLTLPVSWTAVYGKRYIRVEVDSDNVMDELSESNTFPKHIKIVDPNAPNPDLIVEKIEAINLNPQVPGEYHKDDQVKVVVTVKNNSPYPASGIGKVMMGTNMKLGNSSHTSYYYYTGDHPLGAYQSATIELKTVTLGSSSPYYKFSINLDINDKVEEKIEMNNGDSIQIDVVQ